MELGKRNRNPSRDECDGGGDADAQGGCLAWRDFPSLHRARTLTPRDLHVSPLHGLAAQLAVVGLIDGLEVVSLRPSSSIWTAPCNEPEGSLQRGALRRRLTPGSR